MKILKIALAIFAFALTFYWLFPRQSYCRDLSAIEARSLGEEIINEEIKEGNKDIFGYTIQKLVIRKVIDNVGGNENSIDLVLAYKDSTEGLVKIEIYGDCSVEWRAI